MAGAYGRRELVDILSALEKGGDSLSRRSMSRTEEDILSRVDVPIMRNTTLGTYPASYSEVCDTFRPRLGSARRTDSGRERFIHFLVPSPVRSRFVAEHASEGRPACIENGFRQAGLGESGGVHIADRDVVKLSDDARRELVVKVTARMSDTGAEVREQSGQRLDAVSIDQQHRRKLMPSKTSNKPLKLTETSSFRNTKSLPQERHFLPGASAGVSVPEKP